MGDFVGHAYTVAKQNFLVTEDSADINDNIDAVSAPSVAGIMIGDGVDRTNQVEIVTTLLQCMNAMREANMPAPSGVESSLAYGPVGGGKASITVANDENSFPDGNVAVLLGSDFFESSRGAGIGTGPFEQHIRLAIDLWLERIGKVYTGA